MKKRQFRSLFVVAMGLMASMTLAIPRSGEVASPNYIFDGSDLQGIHLGFDGRTRSLNNSDSPFDAWQDEVRVSQYHAVLAYDLDPGLAIYGLFGVGQVDAKDIAGTNREASPSYGVGIWANFFDRPLLTNFETIDRIRVQGAAQYSRFSTDMSDWDEFLANVTVGLVNSVDGSKAFWPIEISIYGGPSISLVWSDLEVNKSSDVFGGIVGIDFLIDRVLSVGASMEFYRSGPAFAGTAMIRF